MVSPKMRQKKGVLLVSHEKFGETTRIRINVAGQPEYGRLQAMCSGTGHFDHLSGILPDLVASIFEKSK